MRNFIETLFVLVIFILLLGISIWLFTIILLSFESIKERFVNLIFLIF